MSWLAAFVFTQLVEIPLYRWLAKLRLDEAFTASALTHPIVWWVVPVLYDDAYFAVVDRVPGFWLSENAHYAGMVVACELYAVAVEALYLRARGVARPLAIAFVVNMASVVVGFVSRYVLGFP